MDPQLEKIFKLPNRQKVALLLVLLCLEAAAIYYALYAPRLKELNDLKAKQTDLQRQIDENRRIANNLPRFKADFEQLKRDLDHALTELPNQKEIPSLLTSISAAGRGAGLDVLTFRPQAENKKDFYAEVPIDILVSGNFYSIAEFFVSVGNMPRIVNISNVNFVDIKNVAGHTALKVSCLATTFRFLDKNEIKNEKKK